LNRASRTGAGQHALMRQGIGALRVDDQDFAAENCG
jgi:hypothetical protein